MNTMYCRSYQACFRMMSRLLPLGAPELLEGVNSFRKLPELIRSQGISRILIVTGQTVITLPFMEQLLQALTEEGVIYAGYHKVAPNPTIDHIEEALEVYHANQCDAILAVGGGSPMDCAKGVAARVAQPNKRVDQMKGLFKVKKKTPCLFTVPTTAGSGSEATIVAVITNHHTKEKFAVSDLALLPNFAILDPVLTADLPPSMTATTGMDALTHAVEAYIGRSNTDETKDMSRKAIKMIFENLLTAYHDGSDLEARGNMLKASYYAGLAFTRALVGNIHAIAHTLGGRYNIPHGLANAVLMPPVLAYYGEAAHQPLAELADLVDLSEPGDTTAQKAERFVDAIRRLNEVMEIPATLDGILESDIPAMVDMAYQESNPLYPVPMIFTKPDFTSIYHQIR